MKEENKENAGGQGLREKKNLQTLGRGKMVSCCKRRKRQGREKELWKALKALVKLGSEGEAEQWGRNGGGGRGGKDRSLTGAQPCSNKQSL